MNDADTLMEFFRNMKWTPREALIAMKVAAFMVERTAMLTGRFEELAGHDAIASDIMRELQARSILKEV